MSFFASSSIEARLLSMDMELSKLKLLDIRTGDMGVIAILDGVCRRFMLSHMASDSANFALKSLILCFITK